MATETEYRIYLRLPCYPAHVPEGTPDSKLITPESWAPIKKNLRDAYTNGKYAESGIQLNFEQIADDGRKEIVVGVQIEKVGELKDKINSLVQNIYDVLVVSNVDPSLIQVKKAIKNGQDRTLEDLIKENKEPQSTTPTL